MQNPKIEFTVLNHECHSKQFYIIFRIVASQTIVHNKCIKGIFLLLKKWFHCLPFYTAVVIISPSLMFLLSFPNRFHPFKCALLAEWIGFSQCVRVVVEYAANQWCVSAVCCGAVDLLCLQCSVIQDYPLHQRCSTRPLFGIQTTASGLRLYPAVPCVSQKYGCSRSDSLFSFIVYFCPPLLICF